MHFTSILALTVGLALSAVSAAPSPKPAPALADTSTAELHKSLLAAHELNKRAGELCDIKNGNDDCGPDGNSGDEVNNTCKWLYLIPGSFPQPGIPVYTCQPA
ncbi:MAG: hypothetical protein M1817_005187 [Caeruleum heppii]|nr:MAG: hypothetical protein M1817_005187 [Caeruleum heppii]